MDGTGRCVKNKVFLSVLSLTVTISSPKEFAQEVGRLLKKIHLLHKPLANLSLHMVRRVVTRVRFSSASLYKAATDSKPFYQQWYGSNTDHQAGHFDLPSQYMR